MSRNEKAMRAARLSEARGFETRIRACIKYRRTLRGSKRDLACKGRTIAVVGQRRWFVRCTQNIARVLCDEPSIWSVAPCPNACLCLLLFEKLDATRPGVTITSPGVTATHVGHDFRRLLENFLTKIETKCAG